MEHVARLERSLTVAVLIIVFRACECSAERGVWVCFVYFFCAANGENVIFVVVRVVFGCAQMGLFGFELSRRGAETQRRKPFFKEFMGFPKIFWSDIEHPFHLYVNTAGVPLESVEPL